MQVLRYCAETGGCVIVDSTRKGKKFPDRLVLEYIIAIKPLI
jgi:hypothetical protein